MKNLHRTNIVCIRTDIPLNRNISVRIEHNRQVLIEELSKLSVLHHGNEIIHTFLEGTCGNGKNEN